MMFRVEKEKNIEGKMKGVMMNESSYVNHGFLENNQPNSRGFLALNSGSLYDEFDAIDKGSSSSAITFVSPFDFGRAMHQDMMNFSSRNMGSGFSKKSSRECMLNVPYDVGLCENFHRIYVGDEQRDYCNTSKFRVEPEGFLGGFCDPLSNSVVGFNNGPVYDYSLGLGLGQGFDIKDPMGPSPFLTKRLDSNAVYSEDEVDNYMRLLKDQGRGYFGQEFQQRGPLMVNDRPEISDGFYNTQQCGNPDNTVVGSSALNNPFLELDLAQKLQMLKEKDRAMPNPCVSFGSTVLSMKNSGEVEGFSYEDSFLVDGIGKCSECLAGKKYHWSKGNKKSSRSEISMTHFREKEQVVDGLMQCQGVCENSSRPGNYSSSHLIYRPLADLQGCIYSMCKHQLGCRFLQRIFDEGSSQDMEMIFTEIVDHIVELMIDPFANYLIQKLLDVCSEEQKMVVVLKVTEKRGELVNICMNTHGTRVVQKLIETIKSRQQISLIMIALKPGLLDLVKDLNGNHVVQRCLQCLTNDQNKFIFDAAAKFCVDIASHRHGCCVLNRCIAYASGKHREKLVSSISINGLLLAQDAFGNYVIQYIIELKLPSAAATLLSQFDGHFAYLSMQKFSSHVVEKCLRCLEDSQSRIIKELLAVPHFDQLLQDRFANYVIQSALEVTKGPLRALLVEAVRPYENLRSSPYCKKIFTRNLLKK